MRRSGQRSEQRGIGARSRSVRLLAPVLWPALAMSAAGAWAQNAPPPVAPVAKTQENARPAATAPETAPTLTDAELRVQVAQWATLSIADRRIVLTELRRRGIGVSVVSETRQRFGYRVVQADGSVVQVTEQVRVVRVGEDAPQGEFGVGFEQRERPIPAAADGSGWPQ